MRKAKLSFCYLTLSVLLLMVTAGCRKSFLSTQEYNIQNSKAVTDIFTKLPSNASHELQLIAANLQSAESQSPFLADFAKQNG